MSEHKTNQSNLTEEQRTLYRERRNKGVRGQVGVVTVHRTAMGGDGTVLHVPLGDKVGNPLSRGKTSGSRAQRRQQWMADRRQARRGSTRGK